LYAHKLAYRDTNNPKYLNEAFYLSEKAKANNLLEAIRGVDALQVALVPDSILQKEKELKVDLNFYQQKLSEAQQENNQSNIDYNSEKLTASKKNYEELVHFLDYKYPKYFELKHLQQTATIAKVKTHLNDHSLLLEYFVGDHHIYVISITKDNTFFHSIPKPNDLEEQVNAFRKGSTDFNFIKKSKATADSIFSTNGYDLFQLLLSNIIEKQKSTINQLIIMPDGILSHLPFEILLTEFPKKVDYKHYPYLLQKFDIGYIVSSTLFVRSQEKKEKTKFKFGGFAPQYKEANNANFATIAKRNGQIDLPFAREEVSQIAQLYSGDTWINEAANEQLFKEKANQYSILHFSMHGIVDDNDPMHSKLLFSSNKDTIEDGLLHAYELYNLNLNAEMAVLSACNSGIGTIQKGEGVMSLSRAFTYAGCPSTVMSLWSVPDESTAAIMVDFYRELSTGKSKDQALKNAKLNYLKQADPAHIHPFHWAGFIVMGNVVPINFGNQYSVWWILGLAGILLSFLGFHFIKKQS